MRRALAILALLIFGLWNNMSVAYAAAGDGPGDYLILASAARTVSGTSATDNTDAINIRRSSALTFQVDVTVASGTTPTLDLYLQSSVDGVNWTDFGHFAQIVATGRRFIFVSPLVAGPLTDLAQQDAAMAVNTVRQGPIGHWLRAKWVIGGTTPSFTFSVRCSADGVQQVASEVGLLVVGTDCIGDGVTCLALPGTFAAVTGTKPPVGTPVVGKPNVGLPQPS